MAYALKNPTGPASENAFKYAVDLVRSSAASAAERRTLLTSMATMNAGQIGSIIDLLTSPSVKAETAKAQVAKAPQAVPGYYLVGDKTYQVKVGKSTGFAYLMSATGTYLGAKGYAGEILADIVANGKAYAVAYGKTIGKCGVCNTKLTNPDSIAAGIGPHCAKKYG